VSERERERKGAEETERGILCQQHSLSHSLALYLHFQLPFRLPSSISLYLHLTLPLAQSLPLSLFLCLHMSMPLHLPLCLFISPSTVASASASAFPSPSLSPSLPLLLRSSSPFHFHLTLKFCIWFYICSFLSATVLFSLPASASAFANDCASVSAFTSLPLSLFLPLLSLYLPVFVVIFLSPSLIISITRGHSSSSYSFSSPMNLVIY
jgi:hypothetical protein